MERLEDISGSAPDKSIGSLDSLGSLGLPSHASRHNDHGSWNVRLSLMSLLSLFRGANRRLAQG